MVLGAVKHYGCVVSPARALKIKLVYEVLEKDHHHVLISVSLRQRVIDAALGV